MQARHYYLLVLGLLIYINNIQVFLTGFKFIDLHQFFEYRTDTATSKVFDL